jgi:hypothetical protein
MAKGDKLSDSQIDSYIESQKRGFKSESQKSDFEKKSQTTWFRQYVRKSKTRLKTITAKIKRQIKQGKGSYYSEGRNPEEDKRGVWDMPKEKKRLTKKEVKTKTAKKKKVKISRVEKEKVKQITRRAPSGRVYSKVELHEGLNSKRAVAWRAKNGIAKGDFKK